jgi:hypothetical protein
VYEPIYGPPPRVAHAGPSGFVVEGRRLERIDLRTAKVDRQTTIRCGKDLEVGNPTPSPSGGLVLVTCGDDGVVLDGMTLLERRRISRIIPGCDNGGTLGGVVLDDGHTMLLSGCGGEAKLDLATGRYVCGDNSGVLGAPYDIAPVFAVGPGGVPTMTTPVAPSAPAGRERVPRCTPESEAGQTTMLGPTSRYRLLHGEQRLTIKHVGGKTIELEEDASYPSVAPDDSVFAYPRGARVVVRSLPDGALRAEIGL